MIRLVILLMVIIFYLTFVVYNMEDKVALKYVMGLSTDPLPVYLLLLAALMLGMVLATMFTIPAWIRMKMELRRQRRTIEEMEEDLNRLNPMPDRIAKTEDLLED